MRQLSSLDAQFLAVEDGRTHGHVSVLGIYDAQSASGRRLRAELLRELVTERLHLLPRFGGGWPRSPSTWTTPTGSTTRSSTSATTSVSSPSRRRGTSSSWPTRSPG